LSEDLTLAADQLWWRELIHCFSLIGLAWLTYCASQDRVCAGNAPENYCVAGVTLMNRRKMVVVAAAVSMFSSTAANAVILVQTSDPGFYNSSIGTSLNDTNGGNTATGYFPSSNDAAVSFPAPPDLSAASSALGNWLTDPLHLNSNWNHLASIPNSWAVGTEVAVMYQFDTLGATNVVASFGVDNGIFVWLDGNYLFGARGPGSHAPGEYTVHVGDLAAGTHFLQLVLEDHGSINGYDVSISADSFIPGPPPVPEAATLAWLGIAIPLWAFYLRLRR
jgi:hypothetical protein